MVASFLPNTSATCHPIATIEGQPPRICASCACVFAKHNQSCGLQSSMDTCFGLACAGSVCSECSELWALRAPFRHRIASCIVHTGSESRNALVTRPANPRDCKLLFRPDDGSHHGRAMPHRRVDFSMVRQSLPLDLRVPRQVSVYKRWPVYAGTYSSAFSSSTPLLSTIITSTTMKLLCTFSMLALTMSSSAAPCATLRCQTGRNNVQAHLTNEPWIQQLVRADSCAYCLPSSLIAFAVFPLCQWGRKRRFRLLEAQVLRGCGHRDGCT